jgi:hypothetical protein
MGQAPRQFLKTDNDVGYYATYTLTLAAKNFPLSISHILNNAIHYGRK